MMVERQKDEKEQQNLLYYITLIIVFLSHTSFHTERFAEETIY